MFLGHLSHEDPLYGYLRYDILAQHIIKAPVSRKRMIYDRANQKVIRTSKWGTKVYEPIDWCAAIALHIPNSFEY